jgi:hypothetical protein
MRGGAQAHLMRCEDEGYYVVKFQNNPQGVRILANELLGTRLGARLGLPTEVVQVGEELIAHTEDLVMRWGAGATLPRRAPVRLAISAIAGRGRGVRLPSGRAAPRGFQPLRFLRDACL